MPGHRPAVADRDRPARPLTDPDRAASGSGPHPYVHGLGLPAGRHRTRQRREPRRYGSGLRSRRRFGRRGAAHVDQRARQRLHRPPRSRSPTSRAAPPPARRCRSSSRSSSRTGQGPCPLPRAGRPSPGRESPSPAPPRSDRRPRPPLPGRRRAGRTGPGPTRLKDQLGRHGRRAPVAHGAGDVPAFGERDGDREVGRRGDRLAAGGVAAADRRRVGRQAGPVVARSDTCTLEVSTGALPVPPSPASAAAVRSSTSRSRRPGSRHGRELLGHRHLTGGTGDRERVQEVPGRARRVPGADDRLEREPRHRLPGRHHVPARHLPPAGRAGRHQPGQSSSRAASGPIFIRIVSVPEQPRVPDRRPVRDSQDGHHVLVRGHRRRWRQAPRAGTRPPTARPGSPSARARLAHPGRLSPSRAPGSRCS